MNNFRSTSDEFMEIEDRWRLLSSREAMLVKREKDVRVKEEEVRRFIGANYRSMPMVSMAMPMQTQMSKPHHPNKHHRNHYKKRPFLANVDADKDYSQFAAKPETKPQTNNLTMNSQNESS